MHLKYFLSFSWYLFAINICYVIHKELLINIIRLHSYFSFEYLSTVYIYFSFWYSKDRECFTIISRFHKLHYFGLSDFINVLVRSWKHTKRTTSQYNKGQPNEFFLGCVNVLMRDELLKYDGRTFGYNLKQVPRSCFRNSLKVSQSNKTRLWLSDSFREHIYKKIDSQSGKKFWYLFWFSEL